MAWKGWGGSTFIRFLTPTQIMTIRRYGMIHPCPFIEEKNSLRSWDVSSVGRFLRELYLQYWEAFLLLPWRGSLPG
jgi:hypothetical protein